MALSNGMGVQDDSDAGEGCPAVLAVPRRVRSKCDPPNTVACFGHRDIMALGPVLQVLTSAGHLPSTWDLDGVEYFSGVQSIVRGFNNKGYHVVPYDIELDPGMDMTSSLGFAHAVALALRVRPGGFVHFAPPCSSFVWVNRYTSGRSKAQALGDPSVKSVADGNLIVVRCMLLVLVLSTKGCKWALEQPGSSLMRSHPRFGQTVKLLGASET